MADRPEVAAAARDGSTVRRRVFASPRLAGAGVGVAITIGIALVITALSWPYPDRPAAAGVDPSWRIGLHLAAWARLRQGVDLVFTFGPLGFLPVPQPYLGGTSLLALLAAAAVALAIVVIVLVEARRVVPLWAAALITLAIARSFLALPFYETFQALILIVCLEVLADRIRMPWAVIAAGLGIAASVAILGKLNVGVFVGAMGGATVLAIGRPWWRGAAVFGVAAGVSGLGLWIATGQSLGDLPAWVSGSIQIVGGYSETMGLDIDPLFLWIYLAFAGIAALFAWTAYRMSVGWPRGRRAGLLLVVLAFGFAMWKTAFAREFPAYVFATFLIGLAVAGAPLADRRLWLTSLLAAGVALLGASRVTPVAWLDVVGSARSIARETVTAIVPGRAERAAAKNRSVLRYRYGLDPTTLGELTGRRVSIDPSEIGVAWAYPEIRWEPLPIFQSYSAYTPGLDRLNADRLASDGGPERILRQVVLQTDIPDWLTRQRGRPLAPGETVPLVVDGRYRWFEAPAAMLETFCRYRELSAIGRWQVLARTGASCGPAEPLGTVRAKDGQPVTVPVEPRPGRFVIVRVHGLEPSLLGRVRTALYKGEEWYATIGGIRYRLVAPTAGDGLLMAVPPEADGSGVFSFGPPIATFSIESRERPGQRMLTYEFESVPLLGP